ncbi:CRISPR-associated helicase Cas3' [Brevibacterium moorei]|uniref:CRISPR-associated helicase Cas3' n=1 Tax=Brevibacterium moorei TaxID=2968457 RepID=UPI00211CEBC7|nr:CRISPR-associated helicase Cas3' [Brevibacterium sp. 68QC2CO]MCQ9385380.1 CRISPR-associated helicase Cas3' [Brevibacterium sp. 68QC2CO]
MNDHLALAAHLWAKTGLDPDTGQITHWLPLPVHLYDTGEVATRLLHHRVSPQQRRVLTASLPTDVELDQLVWFLGASHDLGKSGPAFQGQVDKMAGHLLEQTQMAFDDPGFALNTHDAEPVASQGEFPHSLASEIILARVLSEDFGLQEPGQASKKKRHPTPVEFPIVHQMASIAGAHHGMTTPIQPTTSLMQQKLWPARLGSEDSPWPHVQRALAHHIIDVSRLDFAAPIWKDPGFVLDRAVLSLLTGLVIQADWIASNQDVFPLIELEEDICSCASTQERVDHAWKRLRLPSQWRPAPAPSADVALRHRFDLPDAATPRPGQSAAFNETKDLTESALLILEDETGAGKTEAALLAAENLAQATGATGVFIGLPTQATTNAIFTRVAEWLRHVESHSPDSQVSVALAHGKSLLNRTYRDMRRIRPKDTSDTAELSDALDFQSPPAQAPTECHDAAAGNRKTKILQPGTHDWLSGRKKRILADFVVGTVDQLLMASLKARHVMLRHSGFANKVVIIDEAHAADTTMKVFMRDSLEWLGRLGIPTIILTATLPPAQKADLAAAYRRGLRQRAKTPAMASAGDTNPDGDEIAVTAQADTSTAPKYPVLTLVTGTSVTETEFPGKPNRSVALQELTDDDSTLVATVRELIAEGGCIAVIRNSVKRVQHTAQLLREAFGADVVNVAHARFAASDRAQLDQDLLDRFGKDGARPERAIVVASQVVEQSLDIDFDAVITDLCPVDLLIQRLGRVHRHAGRTRPQPLRDPRCFIAGITDPAVIPPKINGDSIAIYGEHVLLRSLAALQQVCGVPGSLTTPGDVPTLVHTVYGTDPIGPADWQLAMDEATQNAATKVQEIEDFANRWATTPTASLSGLDGWLQDNDGEADDPDPYNRARGRVRDGSESIEVLLVLTDGTGWRTLDWLPEHRGEVIPDEGPVPWTIAEAVANSSIRLPFQMSKGKVGDAVIGELEKLGRPNLQHSPLLRGQLILPLQTDEGNPHRCTGRIGDWTIIYDLDDGLQASRR